jgi:hypothetical protein
MDAGFSKPCGRDEGRALALHVRYSHRRRRFTAR